MTVVPLRDEKSLRPQEFVDHLGESLGVPTDKLNLVVVWREAPF